MKAMNALTILPAGSFATVPRQIGACRINRNIPATLLCFPSCIPYVSVRRGLTSDAKRTFVATYHPVFDSARFDEGSVQLSYRWIHDSPFTVHVLRETTSSRWHVFKCCGSKLLSQIVGDSYGDAMIRATSIGLSDREPAVTFDGITPTTIDEIREENLTQIALAEGSELDDDDSSLHNIEDEQAERPHLPSKQALVFGEIKKAGEATLIFIPEADALRLAAIRRAIASSSTWADFFRLMPPADLTYVLNSMRDCDDDPQPSDTFDVERLPGFCDGDWPSWPEQEMLTWLPAHVCRGFGKMESSVLNGPYLSLDVSRTPEIIAALELAGFAVRWDEELVRRACGS
jgi:hypothetical protein